MRALDHANDDLLAGQLLDELEFRYNIDVASIDLRVRDGSAIMTGCLSDDEELDAAQEFLSESGQIQETTWSIVVDPDRREEDREHARGIQAALNREECLVEGDIQVACVGTRIVVRGSVPSRALRQVAGMLALRRGHGSRLSNRLVVLDEPS